MQVGPLILGRRPPPQRDIFSTLDGEVLVGASLAARLREHCATCLAEVLDARTRVAMDLWQLKPQAILPPFSSATSGYVRERPCPTCNRDGYFAQADVPLELRYDAFPQRDFQLYETYERFGNSRLRKPFSDSVFAVPLLVAAGTFLHVLAAAAVPGLELHPIELHR